MPKVSYRKTFDPRGTVYKQRITVTPEQFEKLSDALEAEFATGLPRKDKYVQTSGYETFLKPLIKHRKVCFLNNTQTRFINMFLGLNLKDENTYLSIKD